MTRDSLLRKTRAELLQLAQRARIAGRSAMTKAKLVAAILSAMRPVAKRAVVSSKPLKRAKRAVTQRSKKPQAEEPRSVRRQVTPASAAPASVRYEKTGIPSVAVGIQQAAESKFYLGRRESTSAPQSTTTHRPSVAPEPWYDLPQRYGDHHITLMVRDPWWLYAYWEVDPGREQALRETIKRQGEEPIGSYLRVYDVTDVEFNGTNAHRFFDIELAGMAENWYIHVEQSDRSYIVDIGIKSRPGRFYTLARSNQVRTPRVGPSDQIDEEWMCPDEDFWKLFGLAGGFGVGKSSMEMKERFEKRWLEEVSSGSVSSISSPGMRGRGRQFWMWVEAELIVYGATEPDAHVTVQGKPIELRPDGTFSIRFALPDGRQEIPVSATSADREETRAISPIVTRATERSRKFQSSEQAALAAGTHQR